MSVPSMSPLPEDTTNSPSNDTSTTIITISVIGAVILILLAAFLFLYWKRHRNRKYRESTVISQKTVKQRFTLDHILGTANGYQAADSDVFSIPSTSASGGDTRPQSLVIQGNPHVQQSMRQVSTRTVSDHGSIVTPTPIRDSIDISKFDAYSSGFKDDEESLVSSSSQQRPSLQPQQSLESNVPDRQSQHDHSAQPTPSQSQLRQQGSDYFSQNQGQSSTTRPLLQQKSSAHNMHAVETQREILVETPKVSSKHNLESHRSPSRVDQSKIDTTSFQQPQLTRKPSSPLQFNPHQLEHQHRNVPPLPQKSPEHNKHAVESQQEAVVAAAAIDTLPNVSNKDNLESIPLDSESHRPPPRVDHPKIDTTSFQYQPQQPQLNRQPSSPLQFNPHQLEHQHGYTSPLQFNPRSPSPLQFNPHQLEHQHGNTSPSQFNSRSTGSPPPIQSHPPKVNSPPIQNQPQHADTASHPLQRTGSLKRSIYKKNRDSSSPTPSEGSLRRSLLRRGGAASGGGEGTPRSERSRSRDSSEASDHGTTFRADDIGVGDQHSPKSSPPIAPQQYVQSGHIPPLRDLSPGHPESPQDPGTPAREGSPESFASRGRSRARSPFDEERHQGGGN
ncbi:2444_t:CDS:2 [Ambispora leptoticha]|uniref:2444_t:CDS:1 n=1 Tax=Ambispora leptoticha TaxID=144679 RepID=A0A9N9G9R2_9GLOM|nr:2444_t:CDS:2 [Ambispora leptoticha]